MCCLTGEIKIYIKQLWKFESQHAAAAAICIKLRYYDAEEWRCYKLASCLRLTTSFSRRVRDLFLVFARWLKAMHIQSSLGDDVRWLQVHRRGNMLRVRLLYEDDGRSVGRSTVVLCDTEEQLATIMADRHSRRRVTFTLQTDRPTDSVEREKHATVSAQRRHEFNFTKTSLKDRLLQLPFPMHVLYVQLHHL